MYISKARYPSFKGRFARMLTHRKFQSLKCFLLADIDAILFPNSLVTISCCYLHFDFDFRSTLEHW